MQVCLFLLMWQRQLATHLGNCSPLCTELLLGSSYPVKDYFSQSILLPIYPCIVVGLSDGSLWNVSNPFQNEIIKYQIHSPLQVGLLFGQLNTVDTAGECEETLENSGTTRGMKGPLGQQWGESHPINLHLILCEQEIHFCYVKLLRFVFVIAHIKPTTTCRHK